MMTPLFLLLAVATAVRLPAGTPAAREKARLCQELNGEESIAACRAALALGLGPERAEAVDQILASRLASLDRWGELVELYRSLAQLRPADASAQYHLGSALLLAGGRAEESLAPLREAARLQPEASPPRVLLGVALNALGRYDEAVAAFEEALRFDPTALDGLPAARATFEASQRQERWP